MTKDGYLNRLPRREVKDDLLKHEKEFAVGDLYFVFIICALYSCVVVFSLWMTVAERMRVKVTVRKNYPLG